MAIILDADLVIRGEKRGDPQLIVFDPQYDFIPDIDAKGLAKRSGDDDTAVFVDA
jgi:hypothetical protein